MHGKLGPVYKVPVALCDVSHMIHYYVRLVPRDW